MQSLIYLLQSIDCPVITDTSLTQASIEHISSGTTSTYMIPLLVLLGLNIILILVNFVLDCIKHRKDNHNYKVHLIAQKGVEVEAELYRRLQHISCLQPGDEHNLLDEIIDIDNYISRNRLYIEKKFLENSINLLDYFKKIQHNMRNKDVKKEEGLFIKLSKVFYGE